MIPPADSLLKYDNPMLVEKNTDRKSPKGRSLRLSTQHSADSAPVPPLPKPRSISDEATRQENEDILHTILPPREWTDGHQLWVQKVSSAPCTRADVVRLEELLNEKLQQRQARQTGICPIRRELYSQCFDELIRQVTITCGERGLLLMRVRDEMNMTLAVYQALYESASAFGMRKALRDEQINVDMEKKVLDQQKEIEELTKQLDEQKAKCDFIEKREAEKRMLEEEKFYEEIQSLKKTNQQLKMQLEGILSN